MKIYIRAYQSPMIGNYSTDLITIPSNSILVSDLKQILYEKYRIEKSQQRLTHKLCNQIIVTLSNEWPLSFFYIKQNSIIYLEFIQVISKSEEISKKMLSNTKSKYLKTLGLFRHFAPPPMGTIVESQNEYIDEMRKSQLNTHKMSAQSGNNDDICDIINSTIKSNHIQQFRELMEQYDDLYDVNKKWKSGWAPIHYACFYVFSEICDALINKYHADVNLISNDNWSPLHLSAFKGHQDIVRLLISNNNTNVDLQLPKIGTALHIACKKNLLHIVSLLSHKANLRIKDEDGYEPIELATDKNVKNLLTKLLNPTARKNAKRRPTVKIVNKEHNVVPINKDDVFELNKNSNAKEQFMSTGSNSAKFDFIKSLPFIPPKPPKTIGYADKMGKLFFNYKRRFIEVDPFVGSFRRFASHEQYPENPIETIPLIDITNCKKSLSWFKTETYYYFEILYKQKQVYRFTKIEICEKWIEIINMAIIYTKFWKCKQEKDVRVTEYIMKQKGETIEIDYNTGDISQVTRDGKKSLLNIKPLSNDKTINSDCKSNNNSMNTSTNTSNNNSNNTINSSNSSNSNSIKRVDTKSKRNRRPNPYTAMENEEKLFEDSTQTKGITYESFEIIECLGAGTFGKVFKVRCKFDGEIYAMKVINKRYLIRNQQLRYAVTECNVLKQAQSPFILTLHYAFQTPDNLYMIIDYCPGGDLNYHIIQNLFEEDEAKFFIAELILGIEHLHSLDIIYRDLKPENILIAKDGHIKLADFGLAKEKVTDFEIAKSFCGSPAYLAPEMLSRRGVGKSADIYGIGAVLYEMICGSPPFYANDMSTMYQNISKNNLMLHDYFSDELKDLLKKLLNRDPKNRIGVTNKEEIKNHPFFNGIDWEKLKRKEIEPPIDLVEIKQNNNDVNDYKNIKFKDEDYNERNKNTNRVKQFTFVRPQSPKQSDESN